MRSRNDLFVSTWNSILNLNRSKFTYKQNNIFIFNWKYHKNIRMHKSFHLNFYNFVYSK